MPTRFLFLAFAMFQMATSMMSIFSGAPSPVEADDHSDQFSFIAIGRAESTSNISLTPQQQLAPVSKAAKDALFGLDKIHTTLTHVRELQKVNSREHPRQHLQKRLIELQKWTNGADKKIWGPICQPTLDEGVAALKRLNNEKRVKKSVITAEKQRAKVLTPDSPTAKRPYKYDKGLDQDYVMDPKIKSLVKEMERVKWQAAHADRAQAHKDLQAVVETANETLRVLKTAHEILHRVAKVEGTAHATSGWEASLKKDIVEMHREVEGRHGQRLVPILLPTFDACLRALTGMQKLDAEQKAAFLAKLKAEQAKLKAKQAKLKAEQERSRKAQEAKLKAAAAKAAAALAAMRKKDAAGSGRVDAVPGGRRPYKYDRGLDGDFPHDAQDPKKTAKKTAKMTAKKTAKR